MKHSLLVVLVLAAAAGLWFALADPDDGKNRAPAPVAAAASESEDGATEAATANADAPAATETADPAAGVSTALEPSRLDIAAEHGWVVTVRTKRNPHDPFPEAAVRLRLYEGPEAKGEPLHDVRMKSGPLGTLHWRLEPPTTMVTLRATGDEKDHVSYGDTERVLAGAPPPELEVRLYAKDCTVAGVVRSSDGEPIAGADVKIQSTTVQSDANGEYSAAAPSGRSSIMVYATAPGYAQERVTAKPDGPGSVARADFELVPGFRIRGRVVDERGVPISDALVRTFYTNAKKVLTDTRGEFVIGHLDPRREQHHVFARKEGYVEAQTRVAPSGTEVVVDDLVMGRGVRVAGHVMDDAGTPLPGAELYIGFSPAAYNRLDAIAGDDGAFVFPNVPIGEQTLVTSYDGLAPDHRTFTLVDGDKAHDQLRIQLVRGHFIGGTAKDAEGKPLAGVSLSARQHGDYIDQRAKTDAEGRFRIDSLPSEDVDLEFYGRGIVRKNVPVTEFDREDLVVVLDRSGKVAGRVVDGNSGEALTEFTIRFFHVPSAEGEPGGSGYSASWDREGHSFSTADGTWDSGDENLTPRSPLGIEARAEGYAPGRSTVRVAVDPDPDQNVIRLFAGATVTGRVVDSAGRPVATARVGVRAADDEQRRFSSEPHQAGNAATDAQGAFTIDGVNPGDSVLIVQAGDRPMFVSAAFTVPAKGRVERTVQLPVGSTLRGTLLAADGGPLARQRVRIIAAEVKGVSHYHSRTESDESGHFKFSGLPAGLYQVSHSLIHGRMSVQAITKIARVEQGTDTELTLQPTGSNTVRGTVRMKDGSDPPARLPVTCSHQHDPKVAREDQPPALGAIAVDGRFQIDGLMPGTYRCSVFHWGNDAQLSGSAGVTVSGAAHDVVIELSEMRRGR